MRKILMIAAPIVFAVAVLSAQEKDYQPTCGMCPGTYVPNNEIQAYVKRAIANQLTDQQVRQVDIGKANVGIAVVHRGKLANPEANVSPGLGNHPYHLGDLQNLSVNDDRKGSLYTVTSRVTLSEGLNTILDMDGSAFIIHEFDDKYLPDPPTKDAPGGPRIACGVIVKE